MAKEVVTISKNDPNNIILEQYHHKVLISGSVKILMVAFEVNAYTGVNQWKQIYTLPTSCLPLDNMSIMTATKNGKSIQVQITTSGAVNFNSPTSLTANDLVIATLPYI